MKTYIKIVLVAIFSTIMIAAVKAQTAHSVYFLEGVPTAHKLNPALAPEYGYTTFPFLGNINVGVSSNVGVGTFFYPTLSGELLNFLDPSVSTKEFLGNLKSQNKMVSNFDMDIVSLGFYKWNGFNTLGVSFHSNSGIQLPKEIFEFLKVGQQSVTEPTSYKIRDINFNSTAYMQIALGHSRRINDQWRVGAKIKGLLGLANANLNIDKMDITMDNTSSQWIIDSKGTGNIALGGFELKSKPEIDSKGNSYDAITGADYNISQMGLAGGGLAFDLGVSYRPIKDLEITASVNDLGFMMWTHNESVETISSGVVYEGVDMGSDEEFNDLGKQFEEMVEFKKVQNSKRTSFLKASLNVGAEYSFLNNAISLGILSHTRFGAETYAEGMLAVNFRAKKAFMMSLNGTVSNMGNSFGAVLSLCPKVFNLFLAVDCYPAMKLTPDYYLPINKFHVNASLGLSFTFGERNEWGF